MIHAPRINFLSAYFKEAVVEVVVIVVGAETENNDGRV
jgi:hypothetical protein